MFGFGKIEVFPVSFHDGHITFRTPKKIGVGKSVKVKLLLAGQDSPSVSLKITEMDENLDDFTGVGLLKERQKRIDALTYQMALAGVEGACRRSTKRVAATIRLRSRQLPNYRGITANVNETGVEINTDGALPVGTPVNLEFDVPEMADLSMQAISIWSTNEPVIGKGTFRAGVEFTETNREALDAWSAFYRRVLESEGASVMMKTMGDGGDAGANYNTRESGRQTSVLESDQVKDELEEP
ncbi:MAG: PilZ domain-containing protein, partial [Candidatus Eremiobacteraeota bacterium]|nr:PilZ domain-containing protein [Candidatus Eremiobacteraeota bacterium]